LRDAGSGPVVTLGVTKSAATIGLFIGSLLQHDPEKWVPVFGQDHASTL